MDLCPNSLKYTLPASQLLFFSLRYPPLSKQQYLWWVTWCCRCAPGSAHSLLLRTVYRCLPVLWWGQLIWVFLHLISDFFSQFS